MQKQILNSLYGKFVPKRRPYCIMVDSPGSPFFFTMTLYARTSEQAVALFRRFIQKRAIKFYRRLPH